MALRAKALALSAGGLLAACAVVAPPDAPRAPPPRPAPPAPAAPAPASGALSAQTIAYYERVQASYLSQGMLRTDDGRADASFDADRLAQAFLKVALYSEYAERNGQLVAQPTPSRLQRWESPVRIGIVTGAAVPPAQAAKDRTDIAVFAARLAQTTGHPVSLTQGDGNFTVLILSEDERRGYGEILTRMMPDLTPAGLRAIVGMSPGTYCLVVTANAPGTHALARAVAVIRAEVPDLLRLSCIHEELGQGMGLPNDSPRVRPSIFNDDEEFALLTPMDALMLRMLYDRRLHPGMTEADAAPVVRTLAAEYLTRFPTGAG